MGIAHNCPKEKRTFDLRWMLPILLLLVTQFVGAVWWASALSADVKAIYNQIEQQNLRLNRIEQQYFVRP